jgi:hypothetical protein
MPSAGDLRLWQLWTDEFRKSNAGMSLKTKDRYWKSGAEAGMSMKTKEIRPPSANFIEKKGQ